MKILKPFLGPQEWPSRVATSPITPTRSVPPVLGWPALAAALAGVGALAAGVGALAAGAGGAAAGLAGLVVGAADGAVGPHALSSVAAAERLNTSIKARRRLSRLVSDCIL